MFVGNRSEQNITQGGEMLNKFALMKVQQEVAVAPTAAYCLAGTPSR